MHCLLYILWLQYTLIRNVNLTFSEFTSAVCAAQHSFFVLTLGLLRKSTGFLVFKGDITAHSPWEVKQSPVKPHDYCHADSPVSLIWQYYSTMLWNLILEHCRHVCILTFWYSKASGCISRCLLVSSLVSLLLFIFIFFWRTFNLLVSSVSFYRWVNHPFDLSG